MLRMPQFASSLESKNCGCSRASSKGETEDCDRHAWSDAYCTTAVCNQVRQFTALYLTIPQHQTARRHGIPLHVLRKHARCAQGAPACPSGNACISLGSHLEPAATRVVSSLPPHPGCAFFLGLGAGMCLTSHSHALGMFVIPRRERLECRGPSGRPQTRGEWTPHSHPARTLDRSVPVLDGESICQPVSSVSCRCMTSAVQHESARAKSRRQQAAPVQPTYATACTPTPASGVSFTVGAFVHAPHRVQAACDGTCHHAHTL